MTESEKNRTITISYHHGNVTLSFETDGHASNVTSMMKIVRRIVSDYQSLWGTKHRENAEAQPVREKGSVARRGSAETSVIKLRVKESLLPSGFFKKGRRTREVSSELEKQFEVKFTSRKVSQALGELRDEGLLSRIGEKGNFVYLQT